MNKKIRDYAQNRGVKLWQIADKLGIQDSNLSKKLRHQLPLDEETEILNLIDELVAERELYEY